MSDLERPLGTYTTRATRVVGWGLLAVLVVAGVLGSIRLGVDLGFLAWLVFLAAVVWVGVLRPRVVADHAGIQVRNLLRDHRVPWARVASFGDRWALEVFTPQGQRIASWAIPARRDIRGALRARRDTAVAQRHGGTYRPPDATTEDSVRAPRVDAASVKGHLDLARLEWKRGDYGHPTAADAEAAGGGPGVHTSWPWQAWAPLLVGVVAVVLTSI